jgi:hypothetical protein
MSSIYVHMHRYRWLLAEDDEKTEILKGICPYLRDA